MNGQYACSVMQSFLEVNQKRFINIQAYTYTVGIEPFANRKRDRFRLLPKLAPRDLFLARGPRHHPGRASLRVSLGGICFDIEVLEHLKRVGYAHRRCTYYKGFKLLEAGVFVIMTRKLLWIPCRI